MNHLSASTIESKNKIGSLKAWFLACRPKTLPLSLPPIMIGGALASHLVVLDWMLMLFALLCSLGIQIGTNLVNDAIDFKKGADGPGRLGPERMTQGGFLSYKQVLTAGNLCFAIALFCGMPLMLTGGWPILCLLCLSVACGYLYTGGPLPLAYTGLSDLFVLIFFGWVGTGIVYYVQTGVYTWACFFASTQIGLLAVVPHAINNLRDQVADRRVQKRTLAVRFGTTFARTEIAVFSFVPFAIGIFWLMEGYLFMALLPIICLPVVIRNVQAIYSTEPCVGYNLFLARSALCAFVFGSLLSLGIVMG